MYRDYVDRYGSDQESCSSCCSCCEERRQDEVQEKKLNNSFEFEDGPHGEIEDNKDDDPEYSHKYSDEDDGSHFYNKLPDGAVLVDSDDNVINNPKDGDDPFAELEEKKQN